MSRSDADLSLDLGCVVYELYILAAALVLRKRRGPATPDGRVATEAILIKSRSLLGFFGSWARRQSHRSDIRIEDFRRDRIPIPPWMVDLIRSIDKRSAHLTWERARKDLPTLPVEKPGRWVLRRGCSIARDLIASGIRLSEPRHKRYLNELRHLYRPALFPAKRTG